MAKLIINAKCSDLCFAQLEDDGGNILAVSDGYVPNFMPGHHYGDYIELEIDTKTGLILNWNKPTTKTMIKDINEQV